MQVLKDDVMFSFVNLLCDGAQGVHSRMSAEGGGLSWNMGNLVVFGSM